MIILNGTGKRNFSKVSEWGGGKCEKQYIKTVDWLISTVADNRLGNISSPEVRITEGHRLIVNQYAKRTTAVFECIYSCIKAVDERLYAACQKAITQALC